MLGKALLRNLGLLALGLVPPPAWGSPLVLPLWHNLGEGSFFESEVYTFNRAQERYRLEPLFVPDYQELAVRLATALRNGTPPPLLQVELGFLPVLVREGLIRPLPPPRLPDLDPGLLALGQVGGRLYGYPLGISVPLLFYNEQALAARKVSPPRNLAELDQAARRLSSRATRGLLFFADGHSFALLVLAAGGSLVQEGQPHFTSPEALRVLSLLQSLEQAGALQVRGQTEAIAAAADFVRGRALMGIGASSLLPVVRDRASIPFPVGMAPLPLEPKGRIGASGSALVVLKGAHPGAEEAIGAFLRFFLEPQKQLAWAQTTLHLPLSQSAQEAWRKERVAQLLLETKGRLVPWHQDAPLLLWYPSLGRGLERALKARVPPEKALAEAEREAKTAQGLSP